MLRCPYCKITISTRTDVCPLCHVRLTDVGNSKEDVKRTPRAYPQRAKLPPLSGTLFDKVYLFAWLSLSLAMIIVEAIVTRHVRFSWISVTFLLYLYLLFRILLRGSEYFPQKVTVHALILTVVIYSLRSVLPEPEIIAEFLLPILYLVSTIAIAVFLIVNYKRPNRYLLNVLTVSLMCVIPFLALVILDDYKNFALSLATMILGLAVVIGTLIFKAKTILSELKRKFHL